VSISKTAGDDTDPSEVDTEPMPPAIGKEADGIGKEAGADQQASHVSSRRGGQYRSTRSTGYRAHSHYTPDELEERAKNAWYWTQLRENGFNTKSELVVAGMTLICDMLEDLYNDGQPFSSAPEQTRRGPSPAGAARQSAAMRDYWNRRNSSGTDEAPQQGREQQ